ncbi:elongation factor P hydroxylase [uncultured Paraglaciecola sp.]|uniref:elongation factor P hydroxylase n=1 Tax=uncultured Paraglaciecola sp. TaxID=1765024 RepID=UPI002638BB90|nr:elongation factor P hydroxylase [uncultured Paraglaciecola sp.]
MHIYQDLIRLFNRTFKEVENTQLVKGGHEPIYLPAKNTQQHHQIVFAHGYFASALHEVAHWCIAGKQRRLLEDYGYWYSPDGRDAKQQSEFEQVEIKPQAIEWAFSCACGKPFKVSIDNLNGEAGDSQIFKNAVKQQVLDYLELGFPPRAATFIRVLQNFYQSGKLTKEMFCLESI